MKAKAIPALLSGLAIATLACALLWRLMMLALLVNATTNVLASLARLF
jgi:hypothetical protein